MGYTVQSFSADGPSVLGMRSIKITVLFKGVYMSFTLNPKSPKPLNPSSSGGGHLAAGLRVCFGAEVSGLLSRMSDIWGVFGRSSYRIPHKGSGSHSPRISGTAQAACCDFQLPVPRLGYESPSQTGVLGEVDPPSHPVIVTIGTMVARYGSSSISITPLFQGGVST